MPDLGPHEVSLQEARGRTVSKSSVRVVMHELDGEIMVNEIGEERRI